MNHTEQRLGVCFSGGAALGFAHMGVIRAFEERGIEPAVISGASMGALVGALYAEGYSYADMMKIVGEYNFSSIFSIVKPTLLRGAGLSSHDRIERMLMETIPHNSFEQLKRPLHIAVTDIRVPEWHIVGSGELVPYLLASMSIPLVFEPTHIGDYCLVDGGVMNNLPVEPLVDSGCYIIGADVNNVFTTDEEMTAALMAKRYYGAMMIQMQRPRVEQCHLYIDFPALSEYDLYDFAKCDELIEIGYQRAVELLDTTSLL